MKKIVLLIVFGFLFVGFLFVFNSLEKGITGEVVGIEEETISLSCSNVLGYWTFDGDIEDSSGNNYDGEIIQKVVFSEGIIGKSIEITHNKDNPYSRVTLPAKVLDGEEKYSISFWTKTTDGYGLIFHSSKKGKPYDTNMMISSGPNRGKVCATSWKNSMCTSARINDGKWHHVVVSADTEGDESFNVYVDGRFVQNSGKDKINLEPVGEIYLGGLYGTGVGKWGATWYKYDGLVDEFAIFNGLLTDKQVSELYNKGKGRIVCGNVTKEEFLSWSR